MTLEAWYTLGIIALVIGALLTNRISIDVVMVSGLALLLLLKVIPVPTAIAGFAHPAVITIGALFIVAAGLQETGAVEGIATRLLGRPKSIAAAQLRLMGPVAVLSAVMNNTPIVAIYLPIVNDWAKRMRFSPSKLYMPLSFAAILGGKITYIGTASNIVVLGLYLEYLADPRHFAWLAEVGVADPSPAKIFWGSACLGVPTTVAGIAFIILFSRWLLPERKPAEDVTPDSRKYQVEMLVQPDSPIVGKTIEEAGLRHLPGLFLTAIERGDEVLAAVAPETRLEANDRLDFVGVLESVMDLRKTRGLVPATDQVEKLRGDRQQRTLVEAVVSSTSPLVWKTVRDSNFRTVYNAAIIAVHRKGQQIRAKIGDIALQPGDTLLLETHAGFVHAHRNSGDFYLVSQVPGSRPIRHERAGIALGILCLLVVLFALTHVNTVAAALACAMLMIGARCVTGTEARNSVNWQVLIVIGAALSLGAALSETHADDVIAGRLFDLCKGLGAHGMLAVVFVLATFFAQLITNNGAAILMFPIAMATARDLHVSPEPFVFTLIVAAGSSYISPVAYQTNLMVHGPGGYRFLDFARLGLPLTIILGVICTLLAPLVFPFHPAGP